MSRMSFSDAEYAGKRKKTRREIFLTEIDQVVPWGRLLAVIEPHYPKQGNGRPPYALKTMLRIHLMQNWFGYGDPAMEEGLYEIAPVRQFAGVSLTRETVPDETTILNFCHVLERHQLAEQIFAEVNAYLEERKLVLKRGTIMDATIIHAPSSTRTPTARATRKCTKRRRATSGTSA